MSVEPEAQTVKLFINGAFVESRTDEWMHVVNPATQETIARVPMATRDEIDAAGDVFGKLAELQA